ncbi:MAG: cytochrome c biogenesis protein ResB, partial [Anoxybacillus mongoliensis]|nr:cytochrome c biogenesis protein ResB [Anoxybacillus mongoliensis]
NYQTDVVLYERVGPVVPGEEPKLKKIKSFSIRVNEPLKHDYYALYQVDFKLDELKNMSFHLTDKQTNKSFGTITIDLIQPEKEYDLGNGYKVQLLSYFPDFYVDENGNPNTRSKVPNNPA